MKKLVSFALVAVVGVLSAHTVFAQKPFEGSVTWKVVSAQMGDQEAHDMTMNIKGDKFEIDMDAGVQGLIRMYPDRANNKMTMVMDAQKMGMVRPMAPDAPATEGATPKTIDLKATGQKSTVGGHAAELYILTTPTESINMWMSKDFSPEIVAGLHAAMENNTRGSREQKQAFRDLAEKGYFPVKIEGKDGGSLELVKVEPKSLPDSTFQVASDITMMPAGMGGGAGSPGMHGGGMPHGQDH